MYWHTISSRLWRHYPFGRSDSLSLWILWPVNLSDLVTHCHFGFSDSVLFWIMWDNISSDKVTNYFLGGRLHVHTTLTKSKPASYSAWYIQQNMNILLFFWMELYEGVRCRWKKRQKKTKTHTDEYFNNSTHSLGEKILRNITKFHIYRQIGSP